MAGTSTLANLVVKIVGDGTSFTNSLNKSKTSATQWAKDMRPIFLAVAGAVVGFGVASVKTYADVGDQIQKMAKRTGLSTEALSELKFAAEQSGTSIESIEKAVKRMSSVVEDGRNGLTETTRALDALGLSVTQLEGLSPEATFDTLATAIANIEDPLRRSALAQDVFGRAGTELLPLLDAGASGMAELREQAHNLGIVFDQEAADKAAELTDAMNRLKKGTQGIAIELADTLMPTVLTVVGGLERFLQGVRDLSSGTKTAIVAVAGAAAGLAVLGLAIPPFVAAFNLIGGAFKAARAAALLFNSAVLANPLVLIAAAVAGAVVLLAVAWAKNMGGIRDVTFKIADAVGNVLEGMVNRAIGAINFMIEQVNKIPGVAIDAIDKIDFQWGAAVSNMADGVDEFARDAKASLAGLMAQFDIFKDKAAEAVQPVEDLAAGVGELAAATAGLTVATAAAFPSAETYFESVTTLANRATGAVKGMHAAIGGAGVLGPGMTTDHLTSLIGGGGPNIDPETYATLKKLIEAAGYDLKGLRDQFGQIGTDQGRDRWMAKIMEEVLGGMEGRAWGGPVSMGRTYVVGERGPELFTAGASGAITPMGGGGGGTTIVMNNPTFNGWDDFTRQVEQAGISIRRRGGWGWSR